VTTEGSTLPRPARPQAGSREARRAGSGSAPWWPTQETMDENRTNCSTSGSALVSSCRCQAPVALGRTQRFQLSPVCAPRGAITLSALNQTPLHHGLPFSAAVIKLYVTNKKYHRVQVGPKQCSLACSSSRKLLQP